MINPSNNNAKHFNWGQTPINYFIRNLKNNWGHIKSQNKLIYIKCLSDSLKVDRLKEGSARF